MARKHRGDKRERGREDGLATEGARNAVERVLVRMRVRVIRRVVGGLQSRQRWERGAMAQERETYVGIEPRLGVILRDLAHAFETPADDDVYPALHALKHRGFRLAERGHEFECRLAHFVLFAGPFTLIAIRTLRDWWERERATAARIRPSNGGCGARLDSRNTKK